SLQEQLLKAGLVKKKANKPAGKKQKSKKTANKSAKSTTSAKPPVVVKKPLADNELPKPVKLEIKALLKENRLNKTDGEVPYNYTVESKVKRCYVNKEQSDQIISGEISIVNWNDRSYLVPTTLIDELITKHPDLRFFSNAQEYQEKSNNTDESEHPIPDDLMW
ncbi:MAG: DUF2058 family protein, partial [Gammaproteobacteria bacterium]|nr:DUF2058 family protein [Gammaproteobacteria bacterium]